MAKPIVQPSSARAALYRTIWRWHFYAGLFVIPFVVVLSITGGIYLFKPQIDAWEEAAFRNLPTTTVVSPVAQVEAALAAHSGARFDTYRVPLAKDHAALVHIAERSGTMRDVFVSPAGTVVGDLVAEDRISATVARIHGSLLLGRVGDWLVELAASWAIVMILTGLYLWWPRGSGLAGVVWPRARAGLRDLHAVTGFWVAGLAVVLLVSGLPWASVWGNAFRTVRAELGLVSGTPDWKLRGAAAAEHDAHDHAAMTGLQPTTLALLPKMVANARAEGLAFPARIKPPGSVEQHGPMRGIASAGWTIKSEAQNRTLVRSVSYDAAGRETGRIGWDDKHPIDKAINLGISWHEGALFGWINQAIGVLTALALLTLAVTSFLMWRRRAPAGAVLGAPPAPAVPARIGGVVAIVFALAVLLPMLAISLSAVLLIEWLVLRRIPPVRQWLGLRAAGA